MADEALSWHTTELRRRVRGIYGRALTLVSCRPRFFTLLTICSCYAIAIIYLWCGWMDEPPWIIKVMCWTSSLLAAALCALGTIGNSILLGGKSVSRGKWTAIGLCSVCLAGVGTFITVHYVCNGPLALALATLISLAINLDVIYFGVWEFIVLILLVGYLFECAVRILTCHCKHCIRRKGVVSVLFPPRYAIIHAEIQVQAQVNTQPQSQAQELTESDTESRNTFCILCMNNVQDNGCIWLSCQHIFHTKCFQDWVCTHSNCPRCRKPIEDSLPSIPNP